MDLSPSSTGSLYAQEIYSDIFPSPQITSHLMLSTRYPKFNEAFLSLGNCELHELKSLRQGHFDQSDCDNKRSYLGYPHLYLQIYEIETLAYSHSLSSKQSICNIHNSYQ